MLPKLIWLTEDYNAFRRLFTKLSTLIKWVQYSKLKVGFTKNKSKSLRSKSWGQHITCLCSPGQQLEKEQLHCSNLVCWGPIYQKNLKKFPKFSLIPKFSLSFSYVCPKLRFPRTVLNQFKKVIVRLPKVLPKNNQLTWKHLSFRFLDPYLFCLCDIVCIKLHHCLSNNY